MIHQNFKINEVDLINFVNLNKEEINLVYNWRNNKSISQWMYNSEFITLNEHNNFIKSLTQNNSKSYFVVKKSGHYIGVINFTNINLLQKHAYLGLYANPQNQEKGKGKLLLQLILETAFKIFKLHTLKLEVIESNQIAINLYKSFGFETEGVLREFVFKDKQWQNVIIMGKINNDV